MTPPVDDPDTLRQILANTEALLLDFDGPICSVFAGIPAPAVADQLRDVLAEGGHTDLPNDVRTAADPFDVLFYAAKLGQDEARYVEAAFRAHEVEAVQSARPTPSSTELVRAWMTTGRSLAIVSNNSVAAIETYLEIHGLRVAITVVSARNSGDILRLKPDPYLIVDAVDELAVPSSRSTLIGDSITDMQASHAAQVNSIGFANKPGKDSQLFAARADLVITDIRVLLEALYAN